jgi:hypothetical protein
MDLNRREVLKGGAAGFLLGFLFRDRDGKLREQPEIVAQPPSAITIRTVPQQAFRASRLMIAGTVVGKRLVPETRFVPCPACDERSDECSDEDEDDDYYCEACDGRGGTFVETGQMIERDVTIVPWSIESLTIGSRSQFNQDSAIPGDLFSAEAVDSFVSLDTAREGQEIAIVVRYTGDKPGGEVFRGALIGTSIDGDGVPQHAVLPISSAQKIVA